MNRTVAVIITIVTSLCCGLPGLASLCIAGLAALGTQMPEVMAEQTNSPEDLMLGMAMFICGGLIGLIIPVVVGFFSFRASQSSDVPQAITYNEPFPPAS